MGLFNKLKEPVFLKENSNAEIQLTELLELEPFLNSEGQTKIRQDIKFLEYGIAGEKNIIFELKNSHIPMYILHDIYLELGDLSAQIDFFVFTRKICFVIECKNLYGDIEINNTGDFIRSVEIGGKRKKEGIYSPITQNQRHLELMKEIRLDRKNNIFTKYLVEKGFYDFNKSIVVLANPKTVLNAKYAKKETKEKVIRADQLITYIKETCKQSKAAEESDEGLLTWANSYLDLHKEIEKDYTRKYDSYRVDKNISQIIFDEESAVSDVSEFKDFENKATHNNLIEKIKDEKIEINEIKTSGIETQKIDLKGREKQEVNMLGTKATEGEIEECIYTENIENSIIFLELKAYRLTKSREERIKPYYIYNDSQLKDLIIKMPKTKDELNSIAGFGKAKVKKYGNDILNIIEKYL